MIFISDLKTGQFFASVHQLPAAVGVLLDVFIVQGKLCPKTVIPGEVSQLFVDLGDCNKVFLGKQAEDGEHHLVGENLPVVDARAYFWILLAAAFWARKESVSLLLFALAAHRFNSFSQYNDFKF